MIFVQPTNYQEALRIIIQSVHPHEVFYQGEATRRLADKKLKLENQSGGSLFEFKIARFAV